MSASFGNPLAPPRGGMLTTEPTLRDRLRHGRHKLVPQRAVWVDLAFSADGKLLAAAGGERGVSGEVRIWSGGDLVKTLKGHADAVYAVAFSPDGRLLATGSYDRDILLWDLAAGKPLRTLEGHNEAVFDLAFRPDGKILASVSADRTVKLWEGGAEPAE